jgi:acyl-CoA reductase-like NAD-dependent aldehyde dehydrogenase
MRMYIGGEWVDKPEKAAVRNKYDGTEIDTVPLADAEDVDRAVATRRGLRRSGPREASRPRGQGTQDQRRSIRRHRQASLR